MQPFWQSLLMIQQTKNRGQAKCASVRLDANQGDVAKLGPMIPESRR